MRWTSNCEYVCRLSRETHSSVAVGQRIRSGFTLVELLVVIAIIAMLVTLLLPAVQAAREAARKSQCANNLKQLGLGMLNFESAVGGFPSGAVSRSPDDYSGKGPGSWYDDHGWYSQIGPFVEQQAWFDMIDFDVSFSHVRNDTARRVKMEMFACPSDLGLIENEWQSLTWARLRANYVVNFGNTNYGQIEKASVPFLGAPFTFKQTTSFQKIIDGTSKTMMMSECKVIPRMGSGWGGPLSDFSTSLGGQTFQGWLPPNSPVPDEIARLILNADVYLANKIPRPTPANHSYTQTIAARSHHPGGVNVVHCDGSVHFAENSIDLQVWRAMSSAKGESFDYVADQAQGQ